MIEINHLYKRYHNYHGSNWVLNDIHLTIPTGVSVGLLGRNGAGKSTLLKLIGGMDSPDKGKVIRHSRVSWPIGLAGGFQGSMTGRQNVKFVARIHGAEHEVARIIQHVEEFAEIGAAFDEPIKTYSSGMRSRLAFGLSLAFDFDIYLSDEATAVGDRAFRAKAKKAFEDKVGQASLVMVSHSEGILKELCQAGILLDNGHAHWFDDINDAIRSYHTAVDGQVSADDEPPAPTDLAQARQQLKQANSRFNDAESAFSEARDDKAPAGERETLRLRMEQARERMLTARRRVEALRDHNESKR